MKRQAQGFVLIVTLLLLIVTMTLLTGYVIFTMMESRNTRSTANMSSGFYAAEAGLNIEVEEIRTIFEDYRRPNLTEGNCEDQDPVTFSDRVVNATVCAEKLVDDASEATRISDADNPFNGLLSFDSVYNINSVATNSDGDVETQLDMQLRVQEIPVFQFAAFYDGNFEVFPGPNMEITGRVHANGLVGLYKSGKGQLKLMENVTSASICKPPMDKRGPECTEGERTMKMYHQQLSNWDRTRTAPEDEEADAGVGVTEIKMPDGSFERFGKNTNPSEWTAEELEDTFQGRAQIINELQVPQASSFARQTAANTDDADDEDAFLYWKRADLRLIAHQPDDGNDDNAYVDVFDEAGRTAPSVTYWKGFDAREGQGYWGTNPNADPGDNETYRTLTECMLGIELDLANPWDRAEWQAALDSPERAADACHPLVGTYTPTIDMPKIEVHNTSGVNTNATRELYRAMLDNPGILTVNVPRNHTEAGYGRPDGGSDWRSPPNQPLNMVVRRGRNVNHSGYVLSVNDHGTAGGHYMWPQSYNPVNNARNRVQKAYFPLGPAVTADGQRDIYAFDFNDNVSAPLPCSVYDNRPLGRVGSSNGGVGIRAHQEVLEFQGTYGGVRDYAQHFVNDLMALPQNTAIMRFAFDGDDITIRWLDDDKGDFIAPNGNNNTFDITDNDELDTLRAYYANSYPVTINMLMSSLWDNTSYEWDIGADGGEPVGIEYFLLDDEAPALPNAVISTNDLGFRFPNQDASEELIYKKAEDFQADLYEAIAESLDNKNNGKGFKLADKVNDGLFSLSGNNKQHLESRWHLSNTFDPHAAHNTHDNNNLWYDNKDGRDSDFRYFMRNLLGASQKDENRWVRFELGGNDEEFAANLHHHGLVVRPGLLQNLQNSWYIFGYDPEDLEEICAAVPTRGELYSYREERELFVLNIDVAKLMQTDDTDLIKLSEDNESESGIVLYASFEGERIDVSRPDNNDFEGNNYAVRLHNAADFSLGNGANATDNNSVRGFTFVSDQAAMIQGDFNCIRNGDGCRGDDDASGDDRRRIGAAVLADSPNILSVNWMDIYSRARLKSNKRDSGDRNVHRWWRDADETRQNVALLGGSDEAGYRTKNNNIEGGGLHNYPRFWENWDAAYRYKGSLVSFNLPQKWSGRFATQNRNGADGAAYFGERNSGCCTIVYDPPERLWEYDKNFESPRNLPPLTPRVVYLRQESFSRDFTRD